MPVIACIQLIVLAITLICWIVRRHVSNARYAVVAVLWSLVASSIAAIVLTFEWNRSGFALYLGMLLWLLISLLRRIRLENDGVYFRALWREQSLQPLDRIIVKIEHRWPDEYPDSVSISLMSLENKWRELWGFRDYRTIVAWLSERGAVIKGADLFVSLERRTSTSFGIAAILLCGLLLGLLYCIVSISLKKFP